MSVLDRTTVAGATVVRAVVTGGVFHNPDGLLRTLRTLRASGATEDVIGLAIPLEGEPDAPQVRARGSHSARRKLNVVDTLMTIIDPHRPPAQPDPWARGRHGALAKNVLGDLTRWIVGVHTFRVPAILTSSPGDAGEGGVWVLGRPNHAAAIAGAQGAARGGAVGALAAVGIPSSLVEAYAAHLLAGQSILTTCETDPGRIRRDATLLRKRGATATFELPVTGSYGERPA